MPRPLNQQLFEHSQSTYSRVCDIAFEQYRTFISNSNPIRGLIMTPTGHKIDMLVYDLANGWHVIPYGEQ